MDSDKRMLLSTQESKSLYSRVENRKNRGEKHLIYSFNKGYGIIVGYRKDKDGMCPIVWWGDEYKGGSFSTLVRDVKLKTMFDDNIAHLIEGKDGETIKEAIGRFKKLSKFEIIPNRIY